MQKAEDFNLTQEIIGAAMEVHTTLGPGLLESAYHSSLCRELELRGLNFTSELPLPLSYKGVRVDRGYRLDIWVEKRVVIEVKSVSALSNIHLAQVLTYLKLTRCRTGLLINFNEYRLKDGVKRVYNKYYQEV